MRPKTYLHASRTARLPLDPHRDPSPDIGATGRVAQALRCLVALAMALLLLPLGQEELFAQQSPPPGQGCSQGCPQNDPYNGQCAPDQQSSDGQQPYAQQPYPASGQTYPQQGYGQAQPPTQPLNAEQLEQLVAPIALYPDALLAQVLAASTYPAQVVDADHWRQAQGYVSPDQIAAGADAQAWDPSLKALTAFPQVLAEMDRNLQWTTDLGNAYYNQPQDVLQAVQVMRQRAQAAGNLQSTPQEAVSYDQGNIELAPVNPEVVYVPAYNPWDVYGQPVAPYPGFSLLGALGSFFGSSPVSYGLGIAMTAFSHTPWGWLAWGLSWLTQSVLFHQANYYSYSTTVADWGFPYGGPRVASAGGAIARLPNSSNRGPGIHGRPGGGYATRGPAFVPRPPERFAGNRPGGGASRGYQTPAVPRPPMQAYNRPQVSRPQQYSGRSGYGSGYSGRGDNYSSRPGGVYSRPQQAYRPPASGVQRNDLGGRSSRAFVDRGFKGSSSKRPRSAGFHLFGGGHGSENFRGGHAPKSFNRGKNFRGGHSGGFHSFGGGHAPKSFSGGKSFGGRHSGGGGHSGGHWGGGHHR